MTTSSDSDPTPTAPLGPTDRLQRWRLVLGGEADASCGAAGGSLREMDQALAALGVPSFACTPDAFPGLMATAIRRDDVGAWVVGQGIKTSRAVG